MTVARILAGVVVASGSGMLGLNAVSGPMGGADSMFFG
jgi:hypothetical protein